MATFVLIHGSWHGAWCWYKVAAGLEAAGHRVIVPDLPAHGRAWRWARGRVTLRTMTRTVCDVLDGLDEPAVVVAHSRGGIVASQAAERRPDRVRALVYLAAYLLRDGERVVDWFRADGDSLIPPHLTLRRTRLTDMLDERAFRAALYADCSDADVALARALLTPEPSLPALTRLKLSDARFGSVPRYYIELLQDRAVSLSLQRRMHAALPCARVVSIDASHSAYFSRPSELVAHLDGFVDDFVTARAASAAPLAASA
jgi:pimeloyl-ACP methyl ester carboxylesterase